MSDKDYDVRKIRETLSFYKKYFKFYKNKFVPITKYEESDRNKKLRNFEILRIFSFAFGCLSLNTLKKVLSVMRANEAVTTTTIKSRNLRENLVTTFSYGLIGFIIGHCCGLKLIFDQTEYIRLRYYYEKSIGYERKPNGLSEDYPFTGKVPYLKSDLEIKHKFSDPNKIKNKKPINKDYEADAVIMHKKIDIKGFILDQAEIDEDDYDVNMGRINNKNI